MLDVESMQSLGGWEGYRVLAVEHSTGSRRVVIRLQADRSSMTCSRCGGCSSQLHEVSERRVRDLPVFEHAVELVVPRRRLWCTACQRPTLEDLPWLGRYRRVTRRLAEACSRLLAVMPIQSVADFYGLHWHTVKTLDRQRLAASLPEPDWPSIRHLVIDEFALHKGHRYATVVLEPHRRQVLWVGQGRSRKTLEAFFKTLPEGASHRIEAVAIDMNTAFEREIATHCPNAEIVYDLFHVAAKYAREVIDRVRVDEANRLRHDRPARRVVKSARWLLLRNRDGLDNQAAVRLDELLAANRNLLVVYLLKDSLKRLWRYRHVGYARRAWQQWCQQALDSGIEALQRFARRLQPYVEGIIAHARYPLHTSVLEGVNNTIKVIKRRAYGYRDTDYFFLKIRAAFPGNAR